MKQPTTQRSIVYRPAVADDLQAVADAIAGSQLATDGTVDFTETDLASDWRRPSFDLEDDTLLATADDRVVAYASEFAGRAEVFVHPDFCGRGIGTTLLRWTEEHARAHDAPQVGQTLSESETAARRLLEAHGYTVRWDTWIFAYDLARPVPEPVPPAGLRLRTSRPGVDDRPVYDLIDTAFSDWPDRDASLTFDDWRATHLDREDTDPELVWLLDDGERLVGAALCLVAGDEGWVDQLAVARSHRGQGLARVLLNAAFAEFQGRGLASAHLSTESRTGARSLYEHVGMTVTRSFSRYTRALPQGPLAD